MMRRFILSFFALGAITVQAQAQKIDFNQSNRPETEGTETGFTPWAVNKISEESKQLDNGMSITVSSGADSDLTLKSSWWKQAVTGNGSKIVGDGVAIYGLDADGNTPNLTDRSVTMTFTVKGLAAGEHSLLAYHNVTDGNMPAPALLDVTVNGTTVLEGVAQTYRELLPSASGQSYIRFTAAEGQDVVISYTSRVESGKEYSTTCVYVNALVFDQPNPKTTALDPYPANEDLHADGDNGSIELSWTMASAAVKNHLYIGTAKNDMKAVTTTTDTKYLMTDVYSMNTYYWRVDEEDAQGNIYRGDTWTFRPRRLAFPGAEGYGRFATGGRGGSVYHVTSLDDDVDNPQPGTLRYGIRNVTGPRTIVFDVAGTITLKGRLTCSDPYVTIAGQTAPGKGILLKGAPLGTASEGITRFIRMRRGYAANETEQARGLDGLGMAGNNHSIMDHCSVGWTIDEAFSSRNAKNITLQRTLISEALNVADHPNYGSGTKHGYAATIGGDTGSYHHNLLAHNEGRNWSISGGLDGGGAYAGHHDMFNNVCYNWGGRATDGGTHQGNFVNNYYKMGPATSQKYLLNAQLEGTGSGSQSYYVSGNIRENRDGSLTNDKEGDTYRYSLSGGQKLDWTVFVSEPFFPSHANIEPAKLAYKTVLSDVGANQPVADGHDIRMVNETLAGTTSTVGSKSGKKGLIDREGDAGGYESFPEEQHPTGYDTDGDGMPDWWETAKGLNPMAADNNNDDDRDGYTALEDYLNWTAEPHYIITAGAKTDINLHGLFAGFGSKASYDINAGSDMETTVTEGTMSIVPETACSGFRTITVTADGNDGIGRMTRRINLFVKDASTGIENAVSIDNDPATVYSIYSVNGTLVRSGNSTEGLGAGIYLLKAKSGNRTITFKVVKK